MSVFEDLQTTIHNELADVAAAIKPPGSGLGDRYLPDPMLISFLISTILVPILNSIVSGIAVHLATKRQDAATSTDVEELKKGLANISSRLDAIHASGSETRAVLSPRSGTPPSSVISREDISEEMADLLERLSKVIGPAGTLGPPEDETALIEKVTQVLVRYGIGPQTGRAKARAILKEVKIRLAR